MLALGHAGETFMPSSRKGIVWDTPVSTVCKNNFFKGGIQTEQLTTLPPKILFTGRNEVVAKVIFLHLSVILFTGGVSASVHAGILLGPPGIRPPLPPPPWDQTPLGPDPSP